MVDDKEARMMPSDFQRYIKHKKYTKLKNTKKSIKQNKGFFTFPDELKGNQEVGERPFLVFYFDSKKQYKTVRKLFEKHNTGARSHPDLNAEKLYRVVHKHLNDLKRRKRHLNALKRKKK